MMRLIPVLLAILLARPALAVDIGDFSQAIPLTVAQPGGIYAVDLPEVVYRSMARADFGDLRVFNGDDRVVPHSLRRRGNNDASPPEDWSAVPVYPLPSTAPAMTAPGIRIDATARRTRVDIDAAAPPARVPVSEWVIDTRALTGPIDRLRLFWTVDAEDAGILRFGIARSDDLSGWQPVPASGVIAALSREGLHLVHRVLKLPGGRYPYLRLQLLSPAPEGFNIDAIQARSVPDPAAPPRYRERAVGRLAAGKKSSGYIFTFNGMRPADRAVLELAGDGQILQGTLSSRPETATDWHRRNAGVFYRIRSGEDSIASGAVDLPMVTDQYWKFDISSTEPHLSASLTLILEWVPHELIFVAEGRPPFRLAYGSDRVTPPDSSMGALMTRLGVDETDRLIGRAIAGQPVLMAGEGAYRRFHLPAAWRRWGLWGVLCAGALMLIVLAWRQFKRMG